MRVFITPHNQYCLLVYCYHLVSSKAINTHWYSRKTIHIVYIQSVSSYITLVIKMLVFTTFEDNISYSRNEFP
jgi:hypothetical protein